MKPLLVFGVIVGVLVLQAESNVTASNDTEPIEVIEKTILVRAETNEERITRKILAVFPDEPRMVKVAKAESTFKSVKGNIDPDDCGIFQINQRYHGEDMDEKELDCMNEDDNIAYARILYDIHGLSPWKASSKEWMQ